MKHAIPAELHPEQVVASMNHKPPPGRLPPGPAAVLTLRGNGVSL